jgi:hypothetical protein
MHPLRLGSRSAAPGAILQDGSIRMMARGTGVKPAFLGERSRDRGSLEGAHYKDFGGRRKGA